MPSQPAARASRTQTDGAVPERLDLNLLEVFDVVMLERHVTRAAHCLGMTQAAVSNALNRLRKRFDDPLFIKAAHGIEPTPCALALWPELHQAMQTLRNTVAPTAFDPRHTTATFRIAMSSITAALITSHLHGRVHRQMPGARLHFVPYDFNATMTQLMRGGLDFAFVIAPQRVSVIQTLPLWSDRLVIAARRDHPLLRGHLSVAAYCAAPQVTVNEMGDEDELNPVETTLAEHELERNVCLSVNQWTAIPDILRNSDLVAVVPSRFAASTCARDGIALRALPFSTPEVVVYLALHQRSNTSQANAWLKQHLLAAAAALRRQTDAWLANCG